VTRRIAAGVVALVVALSAAPARATRPLDTDDTETNDPGMPSLELGADYQRTAGAPSVLFTGLVAVGLARGLELDVQGGVTLLDPDGHGPLAGPSDSFLFLRYRFLDETVDRPALGGDLTLRLPTGQVSRHLGLTGADVQLLLVGQKRVGPFDLLANVGYTFTASGPDLWNLDVAARYPLTAAWTLVAEVVATVSTGHRGDTVLIRGGVAWALTRAITLDAALAGGLARDGPDVVLRTGLSIAF
jgi:Putative MetA-pathway of phenol degradation